MDNNGSKLNDKSELPSELSSLRIRWIRADCGLQQRCYSLFWPLVSSSTAPSMTIFARRRMILCPRRLQVRGSCRTLLEDVWRQGG